MAGLAVERSLKAQVSSNLRGTGWFSETMAIVEQVTLELGLRKWGAGVTQAGVQKRIVRRQ